MQLHEQIEAEIMKRWDEYQTALNENASYSDRTFATKEVINYIKRIDWSIPHLENVIELCKKINFYYLNKNSCEAQNIVCMGKSSATKFNNQQKTLLQNLRNNINNHIASRRLAMRPKQKSLFN